MYKSVLVEMRNRVRLGKVTIPLHAREEMYNDDLLKSDIVFGILHGEIIERQWDNDWHEWKYVIEGEAEDRRAIEIVAKLGRNDDTLVITVYQLF